jgi:two-component system, cell cycle sensor histidine kinase and response regulator CckA
MKAEQPTPACTSRAAPLIFVVDDEPTVLALTSEVLSSHGYRLRAFTDPREALNAVQNDEVKPNILLTDYAMGPMNGVELAEQCLFLLPGLKTIMLSGTVDPGTVASNSVIIHRFLSKPFRIGDLLAVVQFLLAQRPSGPTPSTPVEPNETESGTSTGAS